MLQEEIELNSYKGISEAIYNYANSIKDNFETNIIIRKNKFNGIDYSKELQTAIFNKAKEEFNKIGKRVFINNGEKIYVSNADIKESIAKTVRSIEQKVLLAEHIAVFAKLDKVIEHGVKINYAPEIKNRPKFKKWDYYATPVIIDGEKYIIEFDTTVRDNNEKHFRLERLYKLKDIKKQVVPTGKIN